MRPSRTTAWTARARQSRGAAHLPPYLREDPDASPPPLTSEVTVGQRAHLVLEPLETKAPWPLPVRPGAPISLLCLPITRISSSFTVRRATRIYGSIAATMTHWGPSRAVRKVGASHLLLVGLRPRPSSCGARRVIGAGPLWHHQGAGGLWRDCRKAGRSGVLSVPGPDGTLRSSAMLIGRAQSSNRGSVRGVIWITDASSREAGTEPVSHAGKGARAKQKARA